MIVLIRFLIGLLLACPIIFAVPKIKIRPTITVRPEIVLKPRVEIPIGPKPAPKKFQRM